MKGFCFLAILAVTAFAAMPLNNVPSWGAMSGAYPKGWTRLQTYSYMGHPELDNMAAYANTCVARFTVMLLRMNLLSTNDPASQGRETAIRDGKKYPMYLRVSDIKQYLTAPSINLKDPRQESAIIGERGIIIFQGCNFGRAAGDNGKFATAAKRDAEETENGGGGGVTEHIDLWDCHSQSCLGNGDACRGYIRHCSTVLLFRTSEGCSRPTTIPIVPIPPLEPKLPPPKWDIPPIPTIPQQTVPPAPTPAPTPARELSFDTLETHFDYGIKFGDLQKCMINYELEKVDSQCQESCINLCWPQYVKVDTTKEAVELNKELKITIEKLQKCKPAEKGKRDLFMDPEDNKNLEPEDPDFPVNVIAQESGAQLEQKVIDLEADFEPKPFKHPVKEVPKDTYSTKEIPEGKRPQRPKLDDTEEDLIKNVNLGKPRHYTHVIKQDEIPIRQPEANPHKAVVDFETRKIELSNLEIQKKKALDALIQEQKKGRDVNDKQVQILLEEYKKAEQASSKLEQAGGQDGLAKCLLGCTAKCATVVTKNIASEQAGGRDFRVGTVQTQGAAEASGGGVRGFVQNAAGFAGVMLDLKDETPEAREARLKAEKDAREAGLERHKFEIEGEVGPDGKKKLDGAKWKAEGHVNGKDYKKEGVIGQENPKQNA